jgi:hypothetical protein
MTERVHMLRRPFFVAAMFVAAMSVAGLTDAGVISLVGSNADGTRAIGSGAGDDGLIVDITIGGFPQIGNFAGRTLATITDVAGLTYAGLSAFDAYCVDLGNAVGIPGVYPLTDALMSTWGLGGNGDDGQEAAFLYNSYSGTVANGAQRAGLQLAIWEVLFDGDLWGTSFDLTGGHFTVTSADAAALAFANTIGASLSTADAAWLKLQSAPGSDYPQDFVGPLKRVPEPASWLLLSSGLAAVAHRFRRRRLLQR